MAKQYVEHVGQCAAVAFVTTHFDRAGETGIELYRFGEIVAVEDGYAIIDADSGDHLRCPVANLHRPPAGFSVPTALDSAARPEYIAAEELIRDYHSVKRPLVLRWLSRAKTLTLFKAILAKATAGKQRGNKHKSRV